MVFDFIDSLKTFLRTFIFSIYLKSLMCLLDFTISEFEPLLVENALPTPNLLKVIHRFITIH